METPVYNEKSESPTTVKGAFHYISPACLSQFVSHCLSTCTASTSFPFILPDFLFAVLFPWGVCSCLPFLLGIFPLISYSAELSPYSSIYLFVEVSLNPPGKIRYSGLLTFLAVSIYLSIYHLSVYHLFIYLTIAYTTFMILCINLPLDLHFHSSQYLQHTTTGTFPW